MDQEIATLIRASSAKDDEAALLSANLRSGNVETQAAYAIKVGNLGYAIVANNTWGIVEKIIDATCYTFLGNGTFNLGNSGILFAKLSKNVIASVKKKWPTENITVVKCERIICTISEHSLDEIELMAEEADAQAALDEANKRLEAIRAAKKIKQS